MSRRQFVATVQALVGTDDGLINTPEEQEALRWIDALVMIINDEWAQGDDKLWPGSSFFRILHSGIHSGIADIINPLTGPRDPREAVRNWLDNFLVYSRSLHDPSRHRIYWRAKPRLERWAGQYSVYARILITDLKAPLDEEQSSLEGPTPDPNEGKWQHTQVSGLIVSSKSAGLDELACVHNNETWCNACDPTGEARAKASIKAQYKEALREKAQVTLYAERK